MKNSMKKISRKGILLSLLGGAASLGLLNCFGGFSLTRKVYKFVKGLGNKWVSWLVALVFWIIPVWGIAFLIDIFILNSIEFWTGKNPVSHSDYDKNGRYRRVATRGTEKAVFIYEKFGAELRIKLYKKNRLVKTLFARRDEPGRFYAENGKTRELLSSGLRQTERGMEYSVLEGKRVVKKGVMSDMEYAAIQRKAARVEDYVIARAEKERSVVL